MTIVVFVASSLLTACGGGGNSNGSGGGGGTTPAPEPIITIETGRLSGGIDGATYTSGDTTGQLDADGFFEYERVDGVSQLVAFSMGGVEFAAITGTEFLTINDLVPNSQTTNQQLQNILAFLLLLDEDQDPSNGLAISSELLVFLESVSWAQVDFTDADFANQIAVNDVLLDVMMIEEDTRVLPDSSTVSEQLLANYYCNATGVYNIAFDGDDQGSFVMAIEPFTGSAGAWGYSTVDNLLLGVPFFVGGSISPDDDGDFISGDVSTGAYFSGALSNFNSVSGTWHNDIFSESGSFSGSKVGASDDDFLRYFIIYADTIVDPFAQPPTNFGVVAISVDRSDSLVAYSVDAAGVETELIGTLNANELNLSSGDGALALEGMLYRNANEDPSGVGPGFEGVWSNANTGLSSEAAGPGCLLN